MNIEQKTQIINLFDKLCCGKELNITEFKQLIDAKFMLENLVQEKALSLRERYYGRNVYFRGLLEISSYCKNDCFYCGLRKSNSTASRYRMTAEQIIRFADTAYDRGFRTVVMQGGDDPFLDDEFLMHIISTIKRTHPDIAITLSLGERSFESYSNLRRSGADRYLLRHETNDEYHYGKLHPAEMNLSERKECLNFLKKLGFQVGCGMMIGSPYQTEFELAEDLYLIQQLRPEMIGIGPFIPAKGTPFAAFKYGDPDLTYYMISLIRIIRPKSLIPVTTALSTIDDSSLERGLINGGNVIMPNISPIENRKKYSIYNDKKDFKIEEEDNFIGLKKRIAKFGFIPNMGIGNYGGEDDL